MKDYVKLAKEVDSSDFSTEELKWIIKNLLCDNKKLSKRFLNQKKKLCQAKTLIATFYTLVNSIIEQIPSIMSNIDDNLNKILVFTDHISTCVQDTKNELKKYHFEQPRNMFGKMDRLPRIDCGSIQRLENMLRPFLNGNTTTSTPTNLQNGDIGETTRKRKRPSSASNNSLLKHTSKRRKKSTIDKQSEDESNNQNIRKSFRKSNIKNLYSKRKKSISEEVLSGAESQNEALKSVPTSIKSVRRQRMDSPGELTTDEFENDKYACGNQTSVKRQNGHFHFKAGFQNVNTNAVSSNSGTSRSGKKGRRRSVIASQNEASQDVIGNAVPRNSTSWIGRTGRQRTVDNAFQDDASQDVFEIEVDKNTGTSRRESRLDYSSQDDASQDEASQDDASQDEASQDDASQDEASQDEASQDDASHDEASQDDASQKEASHDDPFQDVFKNDISMNSGTSRSVKRSRRMTGDASQDEASQDAIRNGIYRNSTSWRGRRDKEIAAVNTFQDDSSQDDASQDEAFQDDASQDIIRNAISRNSTSWKGRRHKQLTVDNSSQDHASQDVFKNEVSRNSGISRRGRSGGWKERTIDYSSQDDASQDEASQDEAFQDAFKNKIFRNSLTSRRGKRGRPKKGTVDYLSQDDASQDEASQDDASQDEAFQDAFKNKIFSGTSRRGKRGRQKEVTVDYLSQDEASQDDASQDEASQDTAFQDAFKNEVFRNGGTSRRRRGGRQKEVTADYLSQDEASQDDASQDDAFQDVIKNEVSGSSRTSRRRRRGKRKELPVVYSTQDDASQDVIKNAVFKNSGASQRGRRGRQKVCVADDTSQDEACQDDSSFYQFNASKQEEEQIENRSNDHNLRNSFKKLKRQTLQNRREEKDSQEELSDEESQSEEPRFSLSLVNYVNRQRRISQEESTADESQNEELINENRTSVKIRRHAKRTVNRNVETYRRRRSKRKAICVDDTSQNETFISESKIPLNKLSIVCYDVLIDPAFEYDPVVSKFKKDNILNCDSPRDDEGSAKGETYEILDEIDEEHESFKDPESEDENSHTEDINDSSKQATPTPCESNSAELEESVFRNIGASSGGIKVSLNQLNVSEKEDIRSRTGELPKLDFEENFDMCVADVDEANKSEKEFNGNDTNLNKDEIVETNSNTDEVKDSDADSKIEEENENESESILEENIGDEADDVQDSAHYQASPGNHCASSPDKDPGRSILDSFVEPIYARKGPVTPPGIPPESDVEDY